MRVAFLGEIEVWTIVHGSDANPLSFLMSEDSPIVAAMIGHGVGERVTAMTPSGRQGISILAVLGADG